MKTTHLSKRMLTFFKQYIQLDTSLPGGDNYPKAIELINTVISQFGFQTEIIQIPERIAGGKNRLNLIARRMTAPHLPTLLLYNHIDTVPATYPNAFRFTLREGKAFGRGTADHKGSTVGVLAALEALKRTPLRFNLIFLATTDEETDQLPQLAYLTPFIKASSNTIIFDPDTFAGGVSMAHLGVLQFDITVKGISAHSGMSHLGRNAIEESRKLVEFFLSTKVRYESIKSKYPPFPNVGISHISSRCNINKIVGGIANNVIPDRCTLTVDCRYIPEASVMQEKDMLFGEIKAFCKKERIEYEITHVHEIEGYASSHPLTTELNAIYHSLTGEGGMYAVMGSTPVAQWAKTHALPHFGIGVIRVDNRIHGDNEFVYVRDIENLSLTLQKFLTQ